MMIRITTTVYIPHAMWRMLNLNGCIMYSLNKRFMYNRHLVLSILVVTSITAMMTITTVDN